MKSPSVSLILPCYNERDSVMRLIQSLERLRQQYPEFDLETVVVNDGSTDGTAEILRAQDAFSKILDHPKNAGYGAALKTGLRASNADWVAFMDFDGTCDPLDLPELLQSATQTNADMVLGYRLHSQSQMPGLRRLGNRMYALFLKIMFLRRELPQDVCTGFRVLSRTCAEDLFPSLPEDLSFSPALTTLALKKNYVLIQRPIHYVERLGSSKLSVVRDGFKFLFAIFRFSRLVN